VNAPDGFQSQALTIMIALSALVLLAALPWPRDLALRCRGRDPPLPAAGVSMKERTTHESQGQG
jgi:hypothetical protein